MLGRSAEIGLAVATLLLALTVALVWAPLDSDTPLIYQFRRQVYVGDAFLPVLAGLGMAFAALVHLVLSLLRGPGAGDFRAPPLDRLALAFAGAVFLLCCSALILIYWSGTVALAVWSPVLEGSPSYREMRGTMPWTHLGFLFGGCWLVIGLTALTEGRLRLSRVFWAVVYVLALIAVFDLPFDTLLLPPNADF